MVSKNGVLVLVVLVTPSTISAQVTGGSAWVGGAAGFTTMGGDFTGVSAGPLLRVNSGYVWESGFGFAGALHGSIHATDGADSNPLLAGHVTAGPRFEVGKSDRSRGVFVGVHIVGGVWSILESTAFTAYGFGVGFNLGFVAVSSRGVQFEIEMGYQTISYGDITTQGTSFRANQLNVQIGVAKVLRFQPF